ncbi:MAG: alpha-ketoglutarate-dependent dioxygenase AlkB [Verrucomicrobia bacterium]|jgi:alkylated DNA repair dioxygenase AlkB|nr:alpha-ketoglutarate-dependent dioxygenase AlkB [Verrucomicrobiota bacterium]
MDLFRRSFEQPENLLPKDGIVKYYGAILSWESADEYFKRLLKSIDWNHDEVRIAGKRLTTKRKVAWHGDHPFAYSYSGTSKTAQAWTTELLELKSLVEEKSGETFNSCLLNLYHDGSEGMSWHSDAEKALKKNGAIGSLSLGAERKFSFKHKTTKETTSMMLEHGSFLIMQGTTQTFWQHCLPPTKKVNAPRINLTFRSFVGL